MHRLKLAQVGAQVGVQVLVLVVPVSLTADSAIPLVLYCLDRHLALLGHMHCP